MAEQSEPQHKIGLVPLVLMTTALFMTLRNLPMMAETGMQMLILNTITVFAYLIPTALISAELATGWPQNGVFHWVEAAFGTPVGFIAVFLQWVQSIFGVTSIVAFAAASFGQMISPELATNPYFLFFTILSLYWGATLANFKGTKISERISSVAVVVGVYFPSLLLILAGATYALLGGEIQLDTSFTLSNWVPSLESTNSLVLFMSFVFGFVGIEVSACHAREVKDVQKNYPTAIFIAAIFGFVVTLLGGAAVSFILPASQISSISGSLQAFSAYYSFFELGAFITITAFLVGLGATGQVSTWIVGPVKGMWAAAQRGLLPERFAKTNEVGVPAALLVLQATLISIIAVSFLFADNVDLVFLVLTSVAVLLYSIMYIVMFIAAIRLRYTHPDTPRPYKVPGKNWGIWVLGGIGGLTASTCFAIGFLPPEGLPLSLFRFETTMVIATLLALIIPLGIWASRREKLSSIPKVSPDRTL
ncbi:APC family permease [Flexibacterium corallicola]|uniref:APC family permease n=1 Tax=Flexibacterium corallicola TaxID=3037259 RepID=UPI00286F0E1B|nr:APC family permease [Pseudovibrio sp. M1P-2-3]